MQGCVMNKKHKLYILHAQSPQCDHSFNIQHTTIYPWFRSHLKGQVTQRLTFSHQLLTLMFLKIHVDFCYNLWTCWSINILVEWKSLRFHQTYLHLFLADQRKSDGFGVGVCDIYRLQYYHNCCFNDVQFENIEYFAKPQLTPTLACAVMKGLNSARAHLERVLSLHDSVD